MEPIPFKGCNVVYGKNQPQYRDLPACKTTDDMVISCWVLTEDEMMEILQTGRLWLSQLTFGDPFQPILPTIEPPDCVKRIQ